MSDPWPADAVRQAVLTVPERTRADRLTIASGVSGETLMERAGSAVADEVARRWSAGGAVVLCGPGGNGGDGLVAARKLAAAGWSVTAAVFRPDLLEGDSLEMARRWTGGLATPDPALLEGADVVVDAVYGAGLSRDLDERTLALFREVRAPVVAVDIPSGIDGATGGLRGGALPACRTVTFSRPMPGHLLMPGRAFCGDLTVSDIGIADATVAAMEPAIMLNGPGLWLDRWPWPRLDAHKHARGHLVVAGGGFASSGAARLAAAAGLRIGAGLVTCAMPRPALPAYAAQQTAVMNAPYADAADFADHLAAGKVSAVVLGPGAGTGRMTRRLVAGALETGKPAVLDADALTAFQENPAELFEILHPRCVLTPHEGEFRRLFSRGGDRFRDVGGAAREAGCVVLLKGPDTVIAEPRGRFVVNAADAPFLATAGSGDVLAGAVGGLLAQGAETLDAAAMGCWIHGEAGSRAGPGLVAEDLPALLAPLLRELFRKAPRALAAPAVHGY